MSERNQNEQTAWDESIRNDVPHVNVSTGSSEQEPQQVQAKENTHLDNSHISVEQE
jgi:hypothetical protein